MVSIPQIIGKINPWLYAENSKELLRKYGYEKIPADEVKPKNLAEHTLVYDSSSETLEPVYFFILDLMNEFGLSPEKFVDNFTSTPGSGHFSELQTKASIMQQQATKILGDVNTVLRSVLNITYDLKEFRTRLQSYDDLNSKGKEKSQAARLSLKQIWMDKVDIQKGNSSIKAMALGQAGFQTLISVFLIVEDEKDVEKIELNEMVKRIVKPRIHEFNIWVDQSEKELRKRYGLEKTYLRSQVNSLKLYSRWAKPYLRAAQQLEMKDRGRAPALVSVFNTLLLELTLLGKTKIDIQSAAFERQLPEEFNKLKTKRDYFSCVLVDFMFRGIPQRTQRQQGEYVFGGRVEVNFIAYALNSDELKKLDKELEKSDIEDVLRLIEGATTDSLEQMQKDIDFFLEEKDSTEKQTSGANPFLALFGVYDKKDKISSQTPTSSESRAKEKIERPLKKDDWIEKNHLRKLATTNSKEIAFDLFDIYKKAHGMPSYTP